MVVPNFTFGDGSSIFQINDLLDESCCKRNYALVIATVQDLVQLNTKQAALHRSVDVVCHESLLRKFYVDRISGNNCFLLKDLYTDISLDRE